MEFIRVDREGPITIVTLDRPEVMNAIHLDMHREMAAAFDEFAADPEQLVCMVTGAGDRAFCAGSDVRAAAAAESAVPVYPKSGYAGLATRFDCNKPLVAVVNGMALGGGFEIVLACDIVIASEKAYFALPEPMVGAIALGGGLHRLARRLPLNLAMGMIMTSRRMYAAEAQQHGIVNEVVPPDELMATARRWCEDILKASPVAIQASKAITLRGLAEADVQAALERQSGYAEYETWLHSADFAEGLKAFAERRVPQWSGH